MIKLKDLGDVMSSYRDQRAQLLGMMDAANHNDICDEVMPLDLFSF